MTMARLAVHCAVALVCLTAPARAADLTVSIVGAAPSGMVRAMVFADADSFASQSRPLAALAVTPRDGRVRVTVADLSPGRYAVAAYQDVSGNEHLDRNWLGVPTEPVGFSREARPGLATVTFDEAAVDMADGGAVATIRLR